MSWYMYIGLLVWFIVHAATLYAWLYIWRIRDPLDSFPGPEGWPVVGNTFQLNVDEMHKSFNAWKDVYGGVFKIRVFSKNVIVVSSEDTIHQVLVKRGREFSGRDVANERIKLSCMDQGVADLAPTTAWKAIRKACQKSVSSTGIYYNLLVV